MIRINKKRLVIVACILLPPVIVITAIRTMHLRINISESHVPAGIWQAYPADHIKAGDVVSFDLLDLYLWDMDLYDERMSSNIGIASRLIKVVAALPGSIIERTGDNIAIDGKIFQSAVIEHDEMCKIKYPLVVGEGFVWLMADSFDAYDSRYFGEVPVSIIKNKNRPIWTKRRK